MRKVLLALSVWILIIRLVEAATGEGFCSAAILDENLTDRPGMIFLIGVASLAIGLFFVALATCVIKTIWKNK